MSVSGQNFTRAALAQLSMKRSDCHIGDLDSRTAAMIAAAAENAVAVDRESQFPAAALAAAREQRLLGLLVPHELGGEGASISDVTGICYGLGRVCGASAMVFAMHHIMVAILVRHARASAWHCDLLRELAVDQLLIASSTTEGQGGGDLRLSACAVEQSGSRIALLKDATVMSYGAQADAILTTARRSAAADPSDQVIVALMKNDYELEPLMEWETLGMRGTCSAGFRLKSTGEAVQVVPEPYQKIQAETMMPVAHLTWSAVWAGLAAGAVERARRFVRRASRQGGGQLPPGVAHFTRASMSLRALRGILSSALARFEAISGESDKLQSLGFQNEMNLLKVTTSESAMAIVMSAMQTCGLAGYRNDGEFSISRQLRDVLSSSIMINNDRILANTATASMLTETPQNLWD